ncbi:ParB/RepB/Spo0J family partition protein [Sphingomonas melonis]|uniref:ParB/RepB/Spo0J family partition protein n=1 Tax=Sphingomonas melonis TaxID=152682 RepID=UPI004053BCD3
MRFATEGQKAPIWLRKNGNAAKTRWSVIAGRHRMRAAIRLGWTQIEGEERADERSGADELRRLQIAENLDRRDLRPIERACFIMDRWREAAEKVDPGAPLNQQSQAIRKRWTLWEAISHTSESNRRLVDQAAAEACGKSDRWVRTYRQLYEAVVVGLPDLYARLNAHPLGESLSAMSRLATIKHIDARRKGVEAVLARVDWKSIDDALLSVGLAADKGSRVDPDRLGAVMIDAWAKMPLQGRRAHVEWLMENITHGMAVDIAAGLRKRGLL